MLGKSQQLHYRVHIPSLTAANRSQEDDFEVPLSSEEEIELEDADFTEDDGEVWERGAAASTSLSAIQGLGGRVVGSKASVISGL